MRAILILVDTLRRDVLEMAGGDPALMRNFHRLAAHSVQYTSHFVGGLPCMPARRELHCGRYTFLDRGWGPLEPYDDSMPQILGDHGIYTRLVSDHYLYWDDGGATYHGRYGSWECVRGHESDRWKACLGPVEMPEADNPWVARGMRQNYVNRMHMPSFKDSTLVRTFDLGTEFLEENYVYDNWFLQIESYSPHEPFFNYPEYRVQLPGKRTECASEWAGSITGGDPDREADARNDYRTVLLELDGQLGRVLDLMDAHDMWKDTLLILTADHGTLLGEHGEWGKNRQPPFGEVANTPLFIWDPRSGRCHETDDSLNRMIDIPATILDYFGIPLPENMMGRPVREGGVRGALFGYYGNYVCCTDGRYVYMRGAANEENAPLYTYFLMPSELFRMFPPEQLRKAELVPGEKKTKMVPRLRVPAGQMMPPTFMYTYGNLLYDLQTDPYQQNPVDDPDLEARMKVFLTELMEEAQAPAEQFVRLGLDVSH